MRLLTTDRSLKKGRSYWDGWTVKSRHGVRVAATLGKESNSDCRSLSQRNTPGIFRPRFPQTIRTFYFSFTASPVSSLFFTYHNDVLWVQQKKTSPTEKNGEIFDGDLYREKMQRNTRKNLRIWVLLVRTARDSQVFEKVQEFNSLKFPIRKIRHSDIDDVRKI